MPPELMSVRVVEEPTVMDDIPAIGATVGGGQLTVTPNVTLAEPQELVTV